MTLLSIFTSTTYFDNLYLTNIAVSGYEYKTRVCVFYRNIYQIAFSTSQRKKEYFSFFQTFQSTQFSKDITLRFIIYLSYGKLRFIIQ